MYYNVPLLAPHFANDANSEYITHEPTNKEQNEGTERVEDLENGIEEEDEIPVGLQYSFKVINRLKIFCICMSVFTFIRYSIDTQSSLWKCNFLYRFCSWSLFSQVL